MNSAPFRRLIPFSLFALLAALSIPSIYAQQVTADHSNQYQKWLNEDVRWIISDTERSDFKKLSTDQQRQELVVAFWGRRNPVQGAQRNAFKEEHYRRLAYANEHFAQGVPGWKSDRGRLYIMYGPPDKVVRQAGADKEARLGELPKSSYNSEEWRWKYIEGLGCNVVVRFEDRCECGEYHMTLGENEKSHPDRNDIKPILQLTPGCSVDEELFP